MRGHLLSEPLPPRGLAPWIEPELEELILGLLAKEPRRRTGYADAVAAALERLGASTISPSSQPPARAYLYRPRFAGRQAAMESLASALDRLQAGRGGIVLIGGESGSGKTRLATEAALLASRWKVGVTVGESRPGGGPLHPLVDLLGRVADRCRSKGLAETERLLGRRGRLLARYAPALEGLPGQAGYPEPAALPDADARRRLHRALTETLLALLPERGLLLLDDLHWADELTLDWLEFLLAERSLEERALLVVCAYRTEESASGEGGALRRIAGTPGVVSLELGRLEEEAVASIVGDMLALIPPPAELRLFLSHQSEGNPLFVAEYLRAAVEENADGRPLLWRDREGRWRVGESGRASFEGLGLPRSLRELVGRRLDGLSERGAEVARAACVLGRESEGALLGWVVGLEDEALLESIDELLRRHVLEESAPDRWRFRHDKLRETLYERLDAGQRVRLHRTAAEAIEASFGAKAPRHQADLGRHWEQAGERARARDCYEAAARHSIEGYDRGAAGRLARSALRLAEDPSEARARLLQFLAIQVFFPQARHEEAHALLLESLSCAQALGRGELELDALSGLIMVAWALLRLDEARGFTGRALELAERLGDRRRLARGLSQRGALDLMEKRFEAAREGLEHALRISCEDGDLDSERNCLGNLANLASTQGDFPEAKRLYERVLLLSRQLENSMGEAQTLLNLTRLALQGGQRETARRQLEEARLLLQSLEHLGLAGQLASLELQLAGLKP